MGIGCPYTLCHRTLVIFLIPLSPTRQMIKSGSMRCINEHIVCCSRNTWKWGTCLMNLQGMTRNAKQQNQLTTESSVSLSFPVMSDRWTVKQLTRWDTMNIHSLQSLVWVQKNNVQSFATIIIHIDQYLLNSSGLHLFLFSHFNSNYVMPESRGKHVNTAEIWCWILQRKLFPQMIRLSIVPKLPFNQQCTNLCRHGLSIKKTRQM